MTLANAPEHGKICCGITQCSIPLCLTWLTPTNTELTQKLQFNVNKRIAIGARRKQIDPLEIRVHASSTTSASLLVWGFQAERL